MGTFLRLPPFEAAQELVGDARCNDMLHSTFPQSLPPRASQQAVDAQAFLGAELNIPVIEEMYDWLWLVAAKESHRVDPLHQQHIKKRTVNIAEDPALHLTWYYRDVYLKPVPLCLFNFTFWHQNLLPACTPADGKSHSIAVAELSPYCRSALGFLRTYAFLIRHESDFCIAQREHLVPNSISYEAFQAFISHFRTLSDDVVARRYHYGQLRQTRLNYAVRLLRPKSRGRGVGAFYYHERYSQSGQLLQDWVPVLLFVFALLSLVLSSMQVALGALNPPTWEAVRTASRDFSVAVILICCIITVSMPIIILVILFVQLIFATRKKISEKSVSPCTGCA